MKIIELTEEPILRNQDFITIKKWEDFEYVWVHKFSGDTIWVYDGVFYLIGSEVSYLCSNAKIAKITCREAEP